MSPICTSGTLLQLTGKMNSQWNLENGSFVPPENDLWSSTWAPLTPEKPISALSNANPASIVKMTGHLLGTDSWQQLAMSGISNRYLRHSINFPGGNQITEQNAGPSTDIFEVDGISWSDRPFTDILASASLGFSPLTTEGASGAGLGIAQDFWSLDNLSAHSDYGNLGSGSRSAPIANRGKSSGINTLWNDCMPAQVPQCGFPLPSRPMYDLNSIPPIEGNAPPSITNSLQYVPETPDQVKMGKRRPSATNNSTPDERLAQERNKQEEIPRDAVEGTQNNSQLLLENIGECSRQNQENPVEHVEGIDLNATPHLKPPKRRKHRPKVIVEGKPKRAKPKEAKEKAHGKESTVAKRKYVRRKGLNESATQQPIAAGTTAESQNQAVAKYCRRALNFDLEQTTESISTCKQEKMKMTDQPNFDSSAHSQTLENLTVNSFMHDATTAPQIHREEVSPVQNQPVFVQGYAARTEQRPVNVPPVSQGVSTGFSSAKTKDQQIQDLRDREARDTIRVNSLSDLMNVHVPAMHPIKEVRHVGLQGERNLNLASTSQQTPGQLAASIFSSNVEARGSKRAYYQSNEQAFPPIGRSTTFQTIWQLLQIARSRQNSNTVDSDLFNALKKKKIEDRLNAQRDGMPSWVSGANNSSRQGHLRLSSGVVTPMPSQQPKDMQNVSALDNSYRRIRERIGGCPQECYSSPGFAINKSENHASAQLQSYLQWKEVAGRVLNANSTNLTAVQTCKIQMTPENSSSYGGKEKLKVQQKSLSVKALGPIKLQPASSRGRQKHDNKEMQHLYLLSGAKHKGSSSRREDCNPLDQIIHQLCRLNLNGEGTLGSAAEHNAIVLYKGDGTIIPYEGPKPRRRKPRPKIDLDPETNSMWNLLMGKESEGQQNDKDKEKWWQEEREVFRGRANSFIARMHLIQGDRRFSRWKGSVVDSVIGVFLTQNVSDHLSSSAFMSLAARFPPRSTINNMARENSSTDILFKEPVSHMLNPRGTLVSHENMQQISSKTLLESWSAREFTGMERRNLMEGQTHSSEEDIISSQESYDCSITEGCGGVRSSSGSNSESEDLANLLKLEETSCSISGASLNKDKFMSQELLQSSNSKVAIEHEHRQSNRSKYDHQSWKSDREISTNGNSWCDSPVISEKQPVLLSSCPSIESQMQLKDSKIPRADDDIFAAESMGSCLTMLKSGDAELQSRAPLNQRVLLGSKEKQLMTSQHTTISTSHTCSPSSISGPNSTNSQSSYIQHIHEHEKSISQEPSYATNADDLRDPVAPKQDSMNYVSSIPQKTVLGDCSVPGVDRSFHSQDTPVQINPAKQLSSLEAHKETQTHSLQGFLDRLVEEHGSIDLEWLRDVSPCFWQRKTSSSST